jgi:anti-sigma factor RsiW
MSEEHGRPCAQILGEITAYLDGDLAATECDAIEAHCRECADCAAVVNGLRETVGLCRQAAGAPLPEDVRARALESVRRLLKTHA